MITLPIVELGKIWFVSAAMPVKLPSVPGEVLNCIVKYVGIFNYKQKPVFLSFFNF